MSTQSKVITVFVISLIVSIAAGIAIYFVVSQTKENIAELGITNNIHTESFHQANLIDDYLLTHNEDSRKEWISTNQNISNLAFRAKDNLEEMNEKALIDLIEKNNEAIRTVSVQLFATTSLEISGIQLQEQLAVYKNKMMEQAGALEAIVSKEIFVTQQTLGFYVGLLIALLFINVLIDLTWVRTIIKKLEESVTKETAVLSSIGDGMVAVDDKGMIIEMNNAAGIILGISPSESIGKHYTEVWSVRNEKGEDVPTNKRPIQIALDSGTKVSITTNNPETCYYVGKGRKQFPVSITVTPLVFKNKIIGAVEIFRDVTKDFAINKAKSEFVSLASHQLKTPPTVVKLLTERLLGGEMGKFNEKQTEYLNDIRYSNQRMIDLVNILLNVSRIELGGFNVQAIDKDPGSIVQEIVKELKSVIDKKKINLEVKLPEKAVSLKLDESLFRIALNNIIINAINYSADGSMISITCDSVSGGQTIGNKQLDKDYYVVTVSDKGYGIPDEQQSRIFTKFFRADNARAKYTDGTGLGLYIVKSIISHSGGLVWFISHKNQGSTFFVAIPMTGMTSSQNEQELISLE